MGFLNKATYLTALLRLLPMGVLALYFGGNGLINNRTVDSLYKMEGEILYNGITDFYSQTTKKIKKAYVLKIIDERHDTLICHTFVRDYIEKFNYTHLEQRKHITIYVDPKIDNNIKDVTYNNEKIIKYDGSPLLYIFFLCLGLVYTFITVGYLIKHPNHLFNKGEELLAKPLAKPIVKLKPTNPIEKTKAIEEKPFDHYSKCPACGFILKKSDKECPDCGLNLS